MEKVVRGSNSWPTGASHPMASALTTELFQPLMRTMGEKGPLSHSMATCFASLAMGQAQTHRNFIIQYLLQSWSLDSQTLGPCRSTLCKLKSCFEGSSVCWSARKSYLGEQSLTAQPGSHLVNNSAYHGWFTFKLWYHWDNTYWSLNLEYASDWLSRSAERAQQMH